MPFEFSVENLFNASNITTSTRYLIYLVSHALIPPPPLPRGAGTTLLPPLVAQPD